MDAFDFFVQMGLMGQPRLCIICIKPIDVQLRFAILRA